MNTLHPHWHATDDDARDVPVRAAHASPQDPATVSRKPAAILGILLVAALGAAFFHGSQNVIGQLPRQIVTVYITDRGLEPEEIIVEQGAMIEWINEQAAPQILESDSLCNERDECLYTDIVPSEGRATFALPTHMASGTYNYASLTDPNIRGKIIVTGSAETIPTPQTVDLLAPLVTDTAQDTSPSAAPLSPEGGPETDAMDPEAETASPFAGFVPIAPAADDRNAAPEATPYPTQMLPTNPNTIGTQQRSGAAGTALANESIHAGAPPITSYKPFEQPETGIGTWTIALLGILGIAWVARRACMLS